MRHKKVPFSENELEVNATLDSREAGINWVGGMGEANILQFGYMAFEKSNSVH